ncbi:MAG: hypothetical protein ABIK31_03905 [candidate division WOR-3 bacterium]
MKFSINVPKPSVYGFFELYVIGPKGDRYNELVTTEEIEFNPDELIVDLTNRAVLEKELNTITSKLYRFEYLHGRAKNLLDSLLHEESIYNDQRYQSIPTTPPPGKKEWTDTAKKAYLQATALDDPKIVKLWTYIGKSKVDVHDLSICITALKSHLFKCRDFYNAILGASKPKE